MKISNFGLKLRRETANFCPSFTETVIQKKKNKRFPLKTQHMVNLGQKTAIFDPLKLSTKKKYHQNGFETGETTLVSQKLTKIIFETTLVSQKKTFF